MTRHRVPNHVLDAEDGEPTIRETAEIDALALPPHQRPAAIERMVAERTAAATQRGIEKALEDQVVGQLEEAHRAKVRIVVREDELTANVSPRLTDVYLDDVKAGNVVAVRTTLSQTGKRETYVVLRVRDAEIEWPEGDSWVLETFDRVDISLRRIPAFDIDFAAYPRWSERLR